MQWRDTASIETNTLKLPHQLPLVTFPTGVTYDSKVSLCMVAVVQTGRNIIYDNNYVSNDQISLTLYQC
ncbi:hypothetical protein PPL_04973 [Heterostelium album PN500]|uniref:Uncharacterized protein n=1 Tax=Heterostelium pallidum (strain ATCC 26659 / Pp 5 / PN500) TaxID=670386 RepID=D3B929_HETP5|nr:hypothetical protein PPL_04973 [Heterostelium album PN500]EFA82068.1 hypothetical protein PPL_04973 [Heterostelium album PN500]|eukprot:XP_020434185.1 hypothetical protein PPL_04973 [Heterostelium album PN500]